MICLYYPVINVTSRNTQFLNFDASAPCIALMHIHSDNSIAVLIPVCEFRFFSELCWGKAMGKALHRNAMPQQRKKEESERLRGEREIR